MTVAFSATQSVVLNPENKAALKSQSLMVPDIAQAVQEIAVVVQIRESRHVPPALNAAPEYGLMHGVRAGLHAYEAAAVAG